MKIFVSSTYLDLKDYRIKAKNAIEGGETFEGDSHKKLLEVLI
jgi:hypothetical protein